MSHTYPGVSLGCFIGAGLCGLVLIFSILVVDRDVNARSRRRSRREHQ